MVPIVKILCGDALEQLRTLPDESVHCCVTSPPYWGLRDYGVDGQIGLEKTPEEYIARMVEVFREVRRVLREDATLWLNIGDSYASDSKGSGGPSEKQLSNGGSRYQVRKLNHGLKPKDLVGIPWMLAFALRSDGWWLQQDLIWSKPNPMPESVTDRCTKSHEYIFLLSKSARYFYDAEAIKMPASDSYSNDSRWETGGTEINYKEGYFEAMAQNPKMPHRVFNGERREKVNLRSVWTMTTQAYPESHFATFPEALPRTCILAGCPVGCTVLDPFAGSGTTGKVALELARNAILIELNPQYVKLIEKRTFVTPAMALV